MDIQLTLPKRWGDLKPGQLEKVAAIFLRYHDKHEFLIQCFFLFSGWRIVRWMMWLATDATYFYFKKKGEKVFYVSSELFSQLVGNLQWILNGFYVPSYVPKLKGFPTPRQLLYEITVEQFLTAENYYNGFSEKGDIKQLDKMLACLYCDSFTATNLGKAAKVIGRRPISSRYAAFLWFSGVKTWLRTKYPYVFSSSGNVEEVPPDAVVFNLLSSLNDGDITRNEKILKTRMHEAFFELNNKIEYSKSHKHV
jgi:hypothetical protein